MRRLRHIIADIPELARFAARLGDEDFPTADELAEAQSILAEAKACGRVDLFSAPPNAGVATGGQPEPSGLADCGHPGHLGSPMKKDKLRETLRCNVLGAESPIESMLAMALFYAIGKEMFERAGDDGKAVSPMCSIALQHQIGGSRVDIALLGKEVKIAIECDGHDFHERTKEQAARDKSRDRSIVAEGYALFRFTGSEIWADALGCAEQVVDVAKLQIANAAVSRWLATEGR